MTLAAPLSQNRPKNSIVRIEHLMRGFTLEATRLTADDVAVLKPVLAPGTEIYLSSVPTHPHSELIAPAMLLRAAGFEPVPHLAARRFGSLAELDALVARMTEEAGVRRVLTVGGDRDYSDGPFTSALELIDSGALQRRGMREIGVAGYPDGHPRIGRDVLDRALAAKIEAAEQTGLRVHVVTQFSFDPQSVLNWIIRLRRNGVDQPVRLGMAGPTNIAKLIGYARRCGVMASAHALTRQAGLLKHLVGTTAPDGIVRVLADAAPDGQLGDIGVHLFSFGGVAATARWATAVASGSIDLGREGGFSATPPARSTS